MTIHMENGLQFIDEADMLLSPQESQVPGDVGTYGAYDPKHRVNPEADERGPRVQSPGAASGAAEDTREYVDKWLAPNDPEYSRRNLKQWPEKPFPPSRPMPNMAQMKMNPYGGFDLRTFDEGVDTQDLKQYEKDIEEGENTGKSPWFPNQPSVEQQELGIYSGPHKKDIDTSHTVISGAVASKHPNGPVYIDPSISPKYHPILWSHEVAERFAMRPEDQGGLGMSYEEAHDKVATPIEQHVAKLLGQPWKEYTKHMDNFLENDSQEANTNPPPDPHVDPAKAIQGDTPHHISHNKEETEMEPKVAQLIDNRVGDKGPDYIHGQFAKMWAGLKQAGVALTGGPGATEKPTGELSGQLGYNDIPNRPPESITQQLTGTGPTGERYQTWPERMVRGLISNIAGIGDVVSGKIPAESEEGIKRITDFTSTFMGGGTAFAEKGAAGIFGGRLGARQEQFDAYQRLRLEYTPEMTHREAWQRFGLAKGPEGEIRFEIPDKPAVLNESILKKDTRYGPRYGIKPEHEIAMDPVTGGPEIPFRMINNPPPKLSDVLIHPQLYKHYPDLADIPVKQLNPFASIQGTKGMHVPSLNEIHMAPSADAEEFKSTLLHEIQHAVQSREGFPRGGNTQEFLHPELVGEPGKPGLIDKFGEKVEEFRNQDAPALGGDHEWYRTIEAIKRQELKPSFFSDMVKDEDKALIDKAKDLGLYERVRQVAEGKTLLEGAQQKAFEQYQKLAGEVESRNVQTRMNMDFLERQFTSPMRSEDIPRAEQIIKKQGEK